jgi:hypothetical protein
VIGSKWPSIAGCERQSAITLFFRAMLREPELTRVLYMTLVDDQPVVGTAQQACELDRRLARALNGPSQGLGT